MKTPVAPAAEVNRRDFLRGGSVATLMTMLGGVELIPARSARAADVEKLAGPKVPCAVIGLGAWGREMVNTLGLQKEGQVAAVCDKYPASLKRGATAAPNAKAVDDYRKILDDKEIKAVLIATPSHQHREIVLAALDAGKHVYCEAPLAHTIEDARAIALAAKAAKKQVFQAGLQMRSDPQRHFLLQFIRAGAAGKTVKARAQWNKKHSWRLASPNPEREQEINWRLRADLSPGLIGEIGLHQIDVLHWFMNVKPTAVTGFGSIVQWGDGRDVADTVQAVFEYPDGAFLSYDATLANSFDSDYEMLHGVDAAVMIRANKAWMFKEVDAPLLGWEVYARKDSFHNETGIALVANATKLVAQGNKPVEEAPYKGTPLSSALENFLANVNEIGAAVEDYAASFDIKDLKAVEKYLANIKKQPAAGYKEGYEATVIALKANEAVRKGGKVAIEKELFDLA